MVKVGYQGKHGTFSEIAVLNYFSGQEIEQKSYSNFVDIMNDCDSGILDYAMLPVENSTTGIIARTYDLFKDHHIHAVGEIIVQIRQDLIVNHGTKLDEIRQVYSHPEALGQCRNFFTNHPQILACADQDTAAAVKRVKESGRHDIAALGSYRASEYYDMESLCRGVQDSDHNMTRFLCVTGRNEVVKDADKVSIRLILNHEPGTLYHAMGILAYNDINITMLESRPIPDEPFHYSFYMDFAGNLEDPVVHTAMLKLKQHSLSLQLIGNYKAARM